MTAKSKAAQAQAAANASSRALRIETGAPGAVIESVEVGDGVVEERNGVGTVVALLYPFGIEDL